LSRAIALSRDRLPENFLVSRRRSAFFSIELFFAIEVSWLSAFEVLASLPEWKIESGQERTPSLSVFALVQTVMSMPQVSVALS
jgi:hypothetical protein